MALGLLEPDAYGRSLWCRDYVYRAGCLRSDGCPGLGLYWGDSQAWGSPFVRLNFLDASFDSVELGLGFLFLRGWAR